MPKIPASVFNTAGAVVALLAFLALIAAAPVLAFAVAAFTAGVAADRHYDAYYRVSSWWAKLRGRFSA